MRLLTRAASDVARERPGAPLRIEVDDRNEKIELFDRAWVKKDEDEVRGEHRRRETWWV